MPKPLDVLVKEIFVKTIGWLMVIVGAGAILFEVFSFRPWVDGYNFGRDFFLITLASLLLFSIGALILNLKGSKVYKVILGAAIVFGILFGLVGGYRL